MINLRHAHAEFEPELPSQIDLPEGWEQPSEEKTAVQKFLYPDEDELTSDFAVSPFLISEAADDSWLPLKCWRHTDRCTGDSRAEQQASLCCMSRAVSLIALPSG